MAFMWNVVRKLSLGNYLLLQKKQKTQHKISLSQAMLLMAFSPSHNLHNPGSVSSSTLQHFSFKD